MTNSKILIGGDFAITSNKTYQNDFIEFKLKEMFKTSDLNLINLECPVTTSNSKIIKTGPHLKANVETILDILQTLQIDIVTLANNHLLDYDVQGVSDTLNFCKKNNIQYVGGGMNLQEASETLYVDCPSGKIAIINFAENEWASATEENAGANPMDFIDNAEQIKKAKRKADFVFVIVHGGHEYYNLPSPRMQKQYRFYAEQGANIVIGHHTHCVGGYEEHNGIPIYYSLGNFLFTKNSSFEDWYTGLMLEVEIINGKLISKLHPIKQQKETFQLELIKGKDKEVILNRISSYNNIIMNKTRLKTEWKTYVDSHYDIYLNYWSPLSFINNKYIRGVLNKLGVKLINKKGMALALNLMRCEAHVDMSKEVIRKYLLK